MSLIFLILLIVVILIILLFTVAVRVKVVFDTSKTNLSLTLIWLHSFLKALITIEDKKPILTIYLLNKRLFKMTLFKKGSFKKRLKKGKVNGTRFVKLIDSKDIHVNTYYGFRDPFTTGITCGAINAASQFINIETINHVPDFTTENDYIYFDASAKVNLGSTLLKYLDSNKRLKK
ncbi:MAG TPA: hypothetical protein VIM70_03850 [Clostridium sp.]|uniref:hypothetical protein n=1 Tax=Clostridium sp. TaxID=1506 RepID=UPI002F94CCF7